MVSKYGATRGGTSGGAESLSETKQGGSTPPADSTTRPRSARRRSQGRKAKASPAGAGTRGGLIAGLLLAVLVVWYLDGQDEIVRGVSIGEVEVGGMTRAEAREAVESRASATFEEIRFGDGASTLPGESSASRSTPRRLRRRLSRSGARAGSASALREAARVPGRRPGAARGTLR